MRSMTGGGAAGDEERDPLFAVGGPEDLPRDIPRPRTVRGRDRAWTTAMERGDTPRAAEAALGLGRAVVSSGTIDASLVNTLESTLDRLYPGEAGPRAQVTARLATELYGGELDRARPLADEAVALARSAHDDRTLAAALVARQFVLRGPDHLADRLHVGAELLRIARRCGTSNWSSIHTWR